MNLRFLPEADEEFRETARYYEGKVAGLGLAFIAEVNRGADAILEHPGIGTVVDGEIRKYVLRR